MRTRERHTCRAQGWTSPAPLYCLRLLILALAIAGCASTHADPPARPSLACVIDGGAPASVVDVATTRRVDPAHAPVPHNDDERLVFAQLYEPLVRVDCEGAIVPGLAESWTTSADGRTWTFRLLPDASFWDGAPVTAPAVLAAWASLAEPPPFAWMSAISEREVQVGLHAPSADAYPFAHPSLAVARYDAVAPWPVGTGPYLPGSQESGDLRLTARVPSAGAPAELVFRPVPGGDGRRAIDARAGLLVSTEPAVVEYARAHPAYTTTPLPWSRTYVLLTTAGDTDVATRMPPEEDRAALARDAASVGTRAAAPPIPRNGAPCITDVSAPAAPGRAAYGSIAYPMHDPIARSIAERLAARAWPAVRAPSWLRALSHGRSTGDALTTSALDQRSLAAAIRERQHAGYVLAIPHSPPGECGIAAFALNDAQRAVLAPGLLPVALVDTRAHLLRSVDVGRVSVDAGGTLRFDDGR